MSGEQKGKQKSGRSTAASRADRYVLYQRAVQDPEGEVDFMRDVFSELRGRKPHRMREDFCGTALTAAQWVKQGGKFSSEAYDLDLVPLDWGRAHHIRDLGRRAERLELFQKDVREPSRIRPEIRCAQNFSYSVFHTRAELMQYFRSVYDDLTADGIFMLDVWGGRGATDPVRERRSIGRGVTYVWHQASFSQVTGRMMCHIDFEFADGSKLKPAFSYDWRYWSLPELREALVEAGFSHLDVYFEQYNDDGEGTGFFEKEESGPVKAQFIAYIVAAK